MKQTAHEEVKVVHMLDAASYGAAAEAFSTAVDCKGFDEMLLIVNAGVITATGDVALQLEESADNSTWVDITGASEADTTLVVANDQKSYVGRIDLRKRLRYIRVGYDVDDDAAIMSMDAVLLGAKEKPVTQENTVLFNV